MCVKLHSIQKLCEGGLLALLAALFVLFGLSETAHAHFSYSDPRVLHVAEREDGQVIIMIRMPAPLALLPEDWRGTEETRTPPFARKVGDETILDINAVAARDAALRDLLNDGLVFSLNGGPVETRVEEFRFWSDNARPRFGTLKTALAAFEQPVDGSEGTRAPYFDLTLDVLMVAPDAELNRAVRLESQLGRNFQVMEKLGTVTKLHRNDTTETLAGLGLLDASYPKIATKMEILLNAAFIGAEHIYLGLDHLAMIFLIAIAGSNWRQVLGLATSFTLGHIVTLAAGLYGYAPSAAWFVPLVELGIAVSIIAAGIVIFFRRNHTVNWIGLFVIGTIHGYGFAASASEALFAGDFDPLVLAAFALGLEVTQFAVYGLALPLIIYADRNFSEARFEWRRTVAVSIAGLAGIVVVMRLYEASNVFGIT